ncbi:MAG: hypothetical protein ACRCUX_03080, partial [Beijerinckiaceae bacterium]
MRRAVLALACCSALTTLPAHAVQFQQRGTVALMAGNIQKGDADAFRSFMARPEAREIRELHLASGGGNIREAHEIARMV